MSLRDYINLIESLTDPGKLKSWADRKKEIEHIKDDLDRPKLLANFNQAADQLQRGQENAYHIFFRTAMELKRLYPQHAILINYAIEAAPTKNVKAAVDRVVWVITHHTSSKA